MEDSTPPPRGDPDLAGIGGGTESPRRLASVGPFRYTSSTSQEKEGNVEDYDEAYENDTAVELDAEKFDFDDEWMGCMPDERW